MGLGSKDKKGDFMSLLFLFLVLDEKLSENALLTLDQKRNIKTGDLIRNIYYMCDK